MTLDLHIEKREDYLHLKFNDQIDLSKFKESMEQIYSHLYKYNFSKVLLDFFDFNFDTYPIRKRVVAAMIMFDVFKYVSNIKIAVFMDSKDYDGTVKRYADMNEFNIEMFFTEDDAIQWLIKEKNSFAQD